MRDYRDSVPGFSVVPISLGGGGDFRITELIANFSNPQRIDALDCQGFTTHYSRRVAASLNRYFHTCSGTQQTNEHDPRVHPQGRTKITTSASFASNNGRTTNRHRRHDLSHT